MEEEQWPGLTCGVRPLVDESGARGSGMLRLARPRGQLGRCWLLDCTEEGGRREERGVGPTREGGGWAVAGIRPEREEGKEKGFDFSFEIDLDLNFKS